MKCNRKESKPGLNVRISLSDTKTIELLDEMELTEEYKRDVLQPYLKHLYEDLTLRSDSACGISKSIFLDVLQGKQHA
jgi:hypothetical protein